MQKKQKQKQKKQHHKANKIRKDKVNLFLFADNMIIHVENPKESQKTRGYLMSLVELWI